MYTTGRADVRGAALAAYLSILNVYACLCCFIGFANVSLNVILGMYTKKSLKTTIDSFFPSSPKNYHFCVRNEARGGPVGMQC